MNAGLLIVTVLVLVGSLTGCAVADPMVLDEPEGAALGECELWRVQDEQVKPGEGCLAKILPPQWSATHVPRLATSGSRHFR
jgi:hypothetical protein